MPKTAQKHTVWESAKKVRGKDPARYRQDAYGKTIYKGAYGKSSPMGWDLDHILPKSRGGSDATKNLQVLSSSTNRSKGNSLVKKSRHSK